MNNATHSNLSTNLFKGKTLPPILGEHPLFKGEGIKISKIFPSIGLKNCKEKTTYDKYAFDFKKDGGFVHNMLAALCNQGRNNSSLVIQSVETLRFLATSSSERSRHAAKIADGFEVADLLKSFSDLCDPHTPDVLANAVLLHKGKVELKLYQDINDKTGKPYFKKDGPLFRIYNRLIERAAVHGILMPALEAMGEYKAFSKENVPNRGYDICFSSEGEEGAWDLATMSMRGIKSCQRWDGEYPRCLIGSIASKFVGILYLTSGNAAPPHETYGSLGTKMLKRCVVRYAFDRDAGENGSPCLLLDRMYPDPIDSPDPDLLKIFTDFLHQKTKLPVYYGPLLKNKVKHIYIPNDPVLMSLSKRDHSYQDTIVRTKDEYDLQWLFQNQTEIERYARLFHGNAAAFMAQEMDRLLQKKHHRGSADPTGELAALLENLKRHIPLTGFNQAILSHVLAYFTPPKLTAAKNSREYYRIYLRALFTQRKTMLSNAKEAILTTIIANTSRSLNAESFISYLNELIVQYIKNEIIHTNR